MSESERSHLNFGDWLICGSIFSWFQSKTYPKLCEYLVILNPAMKKGFFSFENVQPPFIFDLRDLSAAEYVIFFKMVFYLSF